MHWSDSMVNINGLGVVNYWLWSFMVYRRPRLFVMNRFRLLMMHGLGSFMMDYWFRLLMMYRLWLLMMNGLRFLIVNRFRFLMMNRFGGFFTCLFSFHLCHELLEKRFGNFDIFDALVQLRAR